MKTVSGKVVSCQQISLSRAAKYMSRFTASDNEASPAFAAYLRRTSAAFNEVVQLHKECKIPLREFKDKKDHSTGILTQGTANSVAIEGEVSAAGDKDSRNVEILDSASIGIGLESQNNGETNEWNLLDVGGVKKSKKKREKDGDVAAAKYLHGGDHNAIKVDDVTNEMGSLDGSQEMKKNVPDVGGVGKKSKKKRASDVDVPSSDKDKPNVAFDAVNASEEVKNNVPDVNGVVKKSKKNRGTDVPVSFIDKDQTHGAINANEVKIEIKEEKESCSVVSVEQRSERNVENKEEISGEKKQKKKRNNEAEERENGRNVETEAADKHTSCKRKHERVADGELDGSQEAVKSKKKKIHTV